MVVYVAARVKRVNMNRPFQYTLWLAVLVWASTLHAKTFTLIDFLPHGFYFGIAGGYGSTTWRGLLPANDDETEVMSLSTPKSVTEGGFAGGVLIGYELNPYFALEASYTRYPDATVTFDEMSLVTFQYEITDLNTKTSVLALMAKIMMFIPNTSFRAFSSFGIANLYRSDKLTDTSKLTPTFGLGLNYPVTKKIMAELAASYTAGYGKSQLNPCEGYVPFLYGALLHLVYRL